MIFITGDTHIPIDIHKLNTRNFKEQASLNKNDYVIICGDFGGVWSNNNEDKYWQIDYIITHTAPLKIVNTLVYSEDNNHLYSFFNMIDTDLNYKHWYFGHFHEDKKIDYKHSVVFNQIIKVA